MCWEIVYTKNMLDIRLQIANKYFGGISQAEKHADKPFCSQPSFAISLLNQLPKLNEAMESFIFPPHNVYNGHL